MSDRLRLPNSCQPIVLMVELQEESGRKAGLEAGQPDDRQDVPHPRATTATYIKCTDVLKSQLTSRSSV